MPGPDLQLNCTTDAAGGIGSEAPGGAIIMKEAFQLAPAALETNRFQMNIYRGEAREVNPKQIQEILVRNNVDVAILRFPIEAQEQLSRLERLGMSYLVADVLVYYQCDLTRLDPPPLRNQDLEFEELDEQGLETLDALVATIFAEYRNHYSMNPILACDLVDAYQEWARSYRTSDEDGKRCWLVKRNNRHVGFATCSFEGEECEGVLYGVMPEASGGGVYCDLIRFTQRFFKERGHRKMKVSTQVQNYAVQKVWSREGFAMSEGYLTVHINSLMGRSQVDRHRLRLTLTAKDVEDFGQLSGDMNPLHFDEAFAREHGFQGRIAHGVLTNAEVSKFYGTRYPGHGTIFLGYSYSFLKPIYPDQPYTLEIGFPVVEESRGFYRSLVRVLDEAGDCCLYGYNSLVKRPA